jgi:ABC-type oligopeptide transport system substrate-binding subunit
VKKAIIITLALTLAGFLILAGCSTKSTSSDTESSQLNMDDFFGGYSPSNEAVAFGDEEIATNFPETGSISPDLNGFEGLNAIQSEPDVLVYSLRILWGMLEYDSTMTSLTDWSGSLSIDTGCIKDRIIL